MQMCLNYSKALPRDHAGQLHQLPPIPLHLFWKSFGFSPDIDSPPLVSLSVSVSLLLSFWSQMSSQCADKGEEFWHSEMCQSRPCLSDYSYIWSWAPVLRSNIFPFDSFFFSLFPFPFSSVCIILHSCFSAHASSYIFTLTLSLQRQVWYLSHAGHRRWMWLKEVMSAPPAPLTPLSLLSCGPNRTFGSPQGNAREFPLWTHRG